jgi:hypothetical protein
MRVFPGAALKAPAAVDGVSEVYSPADIAAAEAAIVAAEAAQAEPVAEPPIIDGETIETAAPEIEEVETKPRRKTAKSGGKRRTKAASEVKPAAARTGRSRRTAKSKVPAA